MISQSYLYLHVFNCQGELFVWYLDSEFFVCSFIFCFLYCFVLIIIQIIILFQSLGENSFPSCELCLHLVDIFSCTQVQRLLLYEISLVNQFVGKCLIHKVLSSTYIIQGTAQIYLNHVVHYPSFLLAISRFKFQFWIFDSSGIGFVQVARCGSNFIVLFVYIQFPSIISEDAFLNPDYYFCVFCQIFSGLK